MMTTRIAILRGINVGGKRKILMKDLVSLMDSMGFKDVKTYIQSGNLIFKSDLQNSEIEDKIENLIQETYGFSVPVIVRSHEELSEAVAVNPFVNAQTEIDKLHLTFLRDEPDSELLKELSAKDYDPDKFVISRKCVFIYCQNKYHQSKLSNNFFEKKLKTQATTRNWKTVIKLLELSINS